MFKRTFNIDGVEYVLVYSDASMYFYIDATKSPIDMFVDKNSMGYLFGDDPPNRVFEKTPSKNVFKIIKEFKGFVDDVIKKYKPFYFVYSANEAEKFPVYKRFAERIAAQYGYYVVIDKQVFRFYKND